jgi:hypothetical protein
MTVWRRYRYAKRDADRGNNLFLSMMLFGNRWRSSVSALRNI